MFRRRFKWNRKYLSAAVIVFFLLIYFLPPLLRHSKLRIPFDMVIENTQVPFSVILDSFILPVNQTINHIADQLFNPEKDDELKSLQNRVINLERQIKVKQSHIEYLNNLKTQNDYLRSLLHYRSNSAYSLLPAEIVAYQPEEHFYFFWIDVGKKQSVLEKMVVIGFNQQGEQGLVGYIVDVQEKHSMVQTILDPQTHISISIEGYNTKAILKGDHLFNRTLNADYINNEFTNLITRKVFTLGIGERYPQGIVIGEIASSGKSLYGLFQSVSIKPIIDFTSLKEVFVIISDKK